MKKINTSYKNRKDEIYHFYSHYAKIDMDNIEEANDHIIDLDLKKEHFDDPLEEFFNIASMCSYMIKNDLYDSYFFETYKEIIEDYNKGLFNDYYIEEDDKALFEKDLDEINEYLKKDELEEDYYSNLSKIYEDKYN